MKKKNRGKFIYHPEKKKWIRSKTPHQQARIKTAKQPSKAQISSGKNLKGDIVQHLWGAEEKFQVELSPDVHMYLGGVISNPPSRLTKEFKEKFAILLIQAIQEQDSIMLEKIGKYMFMLTGIHPDSNNREIINTDYLIGIGKAAFNNLGSMSRGILQKVYWELEDKFHQIVDLIAEVYQQLGGNKPSLLRSYENFLLNGSKKSKETLIQSGIILTHDPKFLTITN